MNIFAIIGAAIAAAAISIIIRRYNKEYALYISLAVSLLIFTAVLSSISPVIDLINSLSEAVGTSDIYIAILLKALAVCYITRFASDCCKDSGENAIAARIDFAGRIAILLISVPLFEAILEIVKELIDV